MSELQGQVLYDSGDILTTRQGERIVEATQIDTLKQLSELLSSSGGRYDLVGRVTQIGPDHFRAHFTWWCSCE